MVAYIVFHNIHHFTNYFVGADGKHSKNMEYLMNYWREIIDSKLKPQGALYAEGGPLKADDLQGKFSSLR